MTYPQYYHGNKADCLLEQSYFKGQSVPKHIAALDQTSKDAGIKLKFTQDCKWINGAFVDDFYDALLVKGERFNVDDHGMIISMSGQFKDSKISIELGLCFRE